jgi:hypothetical protein
MVIGKNIAPMGIYYIKETISTVNKMDIGKYTGNQVIYGIKETISTV